VSRWKDRAKSIANCKYQIAKCKLKEDFLSLEKYWIPAFARMTEKGIFRIFARSSELLYG